MGGYCNPFSPLGSSLSPWRKKGIALNDVIRSLSLSSSHGSAGKRPKDSRGSIVLFRLLGQELAVMGSQGLGDDAMLSGLETKSIECLAGEILSVLAIAAVPDFDIVVNFG